MNKIDDRLMTYLPQIMDQAKTGISIADATQPDNPLIYVNSIFTEIFEYTPEEVLGKNCRFLQGEDRDQPGVAIIRKAVQERSFATATLKNYSKSGKLIYNEISVSPIFDSATGELIYFLGVQKDVTEQMLLEIENERLRELEITKKVNEAAEEALSVVLDEIATPVAVSEKGRLTYVNKSMSKLLAFTGVKYFDLNVEIIDKMIVSRPGHIASISEIEIEGEAKKLALKTRDETKYFLAKKNLLLDMPNGTEIEILAMYDITEIARQKLTIDYQKNKLKSYSEVLEEILLAKAVKKAVESAKETTVPNSEKRQLSIGSLINSDDLEMLRKSHDKKISAVDFFAELDEETIAEMDVIYQLEDELISNVDRLVGAVNKKNITDVASSFSEYGHYIKNYLGFEDLSYALLSLSSFLEGMSEDDIGQNSSKLLVFIEGIASDLKNWSETILIRKEALDIHYLDSSLLSSCLQLQLQVGMGDVFAREDELELF